MMNTRDKFRELILFYKKTSNENLLLYIYRNMRSYIKENGAEVFFEEVVKFVEDMTFEDYGLANNMMNEIEKFALEFESSNVKEEMEYVLQKCNTYERGVLKDTYGLLIDSKSANECVLNDISGVDIIAHDILTIEGDINENRTIESNTYEMQTIESVSNDTADNDTIVNNEDRESFTINNAADNAIEAAAIDNTHNKCVALNYSLIYIGLSKLIKPLLKFKAKEGINLMVHFGLKTNADVLKELLKIYKDKKDWKIEILLFIAFINKKLNIGYENELQECKILIKEIIEFNRSSDFNFVICKLFFFLDIFYDLEIYNFLENFCLLENNKVKYFCAKNFYRFLKYDFIEETKKESIFYNLFFYNKENQMIIFKNKRIFEDFDFITNKIYYLYLKLLKENIDSSAIQVLSPNSTTSINFVVEDFLILVDLFITFFRKYPTKEMLNFFILIINFNEIYLRSKIKKIIGCGIFEIYALIKNKTFTYSNTEMYDLYCKCYYSIKGDYKTFNVTVNNCDCYRRKLDKPAIDEHTKGDVSVQERSPLSNNILCIDNDTIEDKKHGEEERLMNAECHGGLRSAECHGDVSSEHESVSIVSSEHESVSIVKSSGAENVLECKIDGAENVLECKIDSVNTNFTVIDNVESKKTAQAEVLMRNVENASKVLNNETKSVNIDFNIMHIENAKNIIFDKLDKLSLESFDWDSYFVNYLNYGNDLEANIEEFVISLLDENETCNILIKELNVLTLLNNWQLVLNMIKRKIHNWRCKKMFIEGICEQKEFFGEHGRQIILEYTNDKIFYIRNMAKDILESKY